MTIPYSDEATPHQWLLDYGFVAPESEAMGRREYEEAARLLARLAPA